MKTNITKLLILFLSLCSFNAYSQTINASSYPFTSASGVSLEDMTGGTQLIGNSKDDDASLVTNIGFTFLFTGTPYTQFSINANGLFRFGATRISTAYINDLANTTNIPQIAPYWDDLYVGSNGQVWYKVTGTAPNRKLIVEWQNVQIPRTGSGTGAGTFQLWLFESTGVIEFVYGNGVALNSTNGGYSVGFGLTASAFASVTTSIPSCAYGTATNNQTGSITSGTAYIFTPEMISGTVTNLTFPLVGSGSMDLNFTDNATNETKFVVYKSTDNIAFTFLASIPSTTIPGTGASYTYSAAGLNLSTAYYFKIAAVTEGSSSPEISGSQSTTGPQNITSAQTGNWRTSSTWTGGIVPSQYDNVSVAAEHIITVDSSAGVSNLVTSGTVQFHPTQVCTLTISGDLTISAGGIFQSASSGTVTGHLLSLAGDFINNGTVNLSTNSNSAGAIITFTGSSSKVWTNGSTSITNLRNTNGVTINKGNSISSTLTFTPGGTLTVQGANALGFLTITNGMFVIAGTNNFSNPLFNSTGYSIPSTAGFQLNNNNATIIGLAGSPSLSGTLRISNGYYNIGTTNNNMAFNSNCTVIIDSGTVRAVSRFGVGSAGNIINYTQTGGTVIVNALKGNASSSLFCFDAGTSTSTRFTMSDGLIIIVRDSTTSSASAGYRGPAIGANVNITGGLLQLGNSATTPSTTFRILGNAPSVVLNSTNNPSALIGSGNLVVRGDLTLNGTGALSNSYTSLTISGNSTAYPGNFYINGAVFNLTSSNTQTLTFNSSFGNQVFTNNGTIFNSLLPSITIANAFPSGTVTIPSITIMGGATLTLTSGTLIGDLTFGQNNSYSFSLIKTNGSYSGTPVFNFGTGTVNYQYNQSASLNSSGSELPSAVDNLTINSTNGVAINSSLQVKGSLALTNGNLNLGSNILTLGSSISSIGSLTVINSATGASITGKLKRWVGTATGTAISFPVGITGVQRNAAITFTSAPTTGGTLTTEWVSSNPGETGLPLTQGLIEVNATADEGFWRITPGDGFTLGAGAFTAAFNANSLTGVTDFTTLVQLNRNDNTSPWTLLGIHSTPTGNNTSPLLTRTVVTGFGEFTVGANNLNNPLPVELSSFSAIAKGKEIILNWETKSEINSSVFIVERSDNKTWNIVGQVKANGNTNSPVKYLYKDASVNSGKYSYRLKMVDIDGQFEYSSIQEAEVEIPAAFSLSQNYPNPFNPSTRINYQVPADSKVTLEIFNISGEKIAELVNKEHAAGYYSVDFSGRNLTSGVYIYRMVSIDKTSGFRFTDSRKFMLIK